MHVLKDCSVSGMESNEAFRHETAIESQVTNTNSTRKHNKKLILCGTENEHSQVILENSFNCVFNFLPKTENNTIRNHTKWFQLKPRTIIFLPLFQNVSSSFDLCYLFSSHKKTSFLYTSNRGCQDLYAKLPPTFSLSLFTLIKANCFWKNKLRNMIITWAQSNHNSTDTKQAYLYLLSPYLVNSPGNLVRPITLFPFCFPCYSQTYSSILFTEELP